MDKTTLSVPSVSRMVSVEVLDSTQNLARALAAADTPNRTLVLAYEQTGGRGQYDRHWQSGRGGVYFTLVLYPGKKACLNANLSLKTAEAVCAVLKKLFHLKTKIKHPNDVLVWEEKTKSWKKICGILIEAVTEEEKTKCLLVGVGINVNNRLTPSLDSTAVSLKKLLATDIDPEWILQEVLEEFWLRYAYWQKSAQP